MTKLQYLAEAERYERLAREGRNQVVSGTSPEHYDNMARQMRRQAASVPDEGDDADREVRRLFFG
jgi:hypothetical protein